MKLFLILIAVIGSSLTCFSQTASKPPNIEYDGTEYHKKPSEMEKDTRKLAKKQAKEYKRLMKRNSKSKKNIEKLKKGGKFSGVVVPCEG